MRYLIIIFLLAACAHRAVIETQPIAVSIVTPIPRPELKCTIPALPAQPIIVGFPDERGSVIYVTKSDLINVLTYQSELMRWAERVSTCLGTLGADVSEP